MMRLLCRFLLPAALVAMPVPAGAQGAFARNFPWASNEGFPDPLYLVLCLPTTTTTACPADGMALLPDPALYTNLRLRVLGGPFRQRYEVEDMRAALVDEGMPSHAMYIFVVDRAGATLGGFWMGALPTCLDLHARERLSGDVTADFSPSGARPETFPVTQDAFGAYLAYVESIRAECSERLRGGQASTIPEGMPADLNDR